MMRADGRKRHRLTRADDAAPSFSPDGRSLYFIRRSPDEDRQRRLVPPRDRRPGIYRLRLTGGRPERIARGHWYTLSVADQGAGAGAGLAQRPDVQGARSTGIHNSPLPRAPSSPASTIESRHGPGSRR
jgi:hypothetical protein